MADGFFCLYILSEARIDKEDRRWLEKAGCPCFGSSTFVNLCLASCDSALGFPFFIYVLKQGDQNHPKCVEVEHFYSHCQRPWKFALCICVSA